MREEVNDHGYRASELLELLLLAVGSRPERRRLLRVSQKDACVAVRGQIWEIWHDKLLHLPPRWNEAAAAMARYNAMERRARNLAAGLPPEQVKVPQAPVTPPVTRPEENTKPATLQPTPGHELKIATTTEPTLPELSERQAGERVVKEEEQAPPAPPVAGGKWEEIEISFISDERVQIRRGKKTQTLNYAEFGFADGRSGNPNQAWPVLRRLAERHGSIESEMEAGMDWSRLEKRIQEIRSVLREHFGIASDPIPFLEKSRMQDKSGYNARFKISCARAYRS
jgi:hypothetical protein